MSCLPSLFSTLPHGEAQVQGGKLFFCKPLQDVKNTTLDIALNATPQRFRLVDCHHLIYKDELCIYEFEEFPTVPYATLSYVWRGNPVSSGWREELGTFSVKGAEDRDPISLDILQSVGEAISLGKQYATGPFLWLDRLSVLQTDGTDKAWQISHMYRIFESCIVCVVLPGGIRQLIKLDEETSWIHRAWTLQECLAPKNVQVFTKAMAPKELTVSCTSWLKTNLYGVYARMLLTQKNLTKNLVHL